MPSSYFFNIFSKGQASTEYIILLAVILTIAIITLAVSGFFPSFSYSAQTGDSAKYWSSSASPIAIIDSRQINTSLELVLENRAGAQITIHNASVSTKAGIYSNSTSIRLAPGATATSSFSVWQCSARQPASYDIIFSYSLDDINLTQKGLKPLYILCN